MRFLGDSMAPRCARSGAERSNSGRSMPEAAGAKPNQAKPRSKSKGSELAWSGAKNGESKHAKPYAGGRGPAQAWPCSSSMEPRWMWSEAKGGRSSHDIPYASSMLPSLMKLRVAMDEPVVTRSKVKGVSSRQATL